MTERNTYTIRYYVESYNNKGEPQYEMTEKSVVAADMSVMGPFLQLWAPPRSAENKTRQFMVPHRNVVDISLEESTEGG